MIIKSLELENIRSYRELRLRLPEGLVLFEGDIGSGKSTLLYAIELALFGPAEAETRRKSDFYIRSGEASGWVRLDLEVSGRDYSLFRELRRTGSGECSITEGGARTLLSPTEMRRKVLELVGFNEPPGARASSVIYRYAVFTPQEEMKEILRMREDERLQTLRRAFRVEEYRIARERGVEVARHLRSRAEGLEEAERELEGLRRGLEERRSAREALERELATVGEELSASAASLSALEEELRGLEALREQREALLAREGRLAERVGQLEARASALDRELESLRRDARRAEELKPRVEETRAEEERLERLEEELRERQTLERELAGLRERVRGLEERLAGLGEKEARRAELLKRARALRPELEQTPSVERSLETHQRMEERLRRRAGALEGKVAELAEERRSLSELEGRKRCPRCGQELSSAHIERLLGEIGRRLGELSAEREECARRLADREERVRACRQRLRELEGLRAELRSLEERLGELDRELESRTGLVRERDGATAELRRVEEELGRREVEPELAALRSRRAVWDRLRRELSELEGRAASMEQREAERGAVRGELEAARRELEGARRELVEVAGGFSEEAYRAARARREVELGRLGSLKAALEEKRRRGEEVSRELAREEDRVREKEAAVAAMAGWREAASWLRDVFAPALEDIERHVLADINARFDELFRRWLGALTEGTELEAFVDEGFAPVVSQGGYELDVRALSGGEKSAVALAYRLALNQMVKEVAELDRDNLLILDEPTDGFSSEQLARVRDVLRALGARQLILVSHERELEGFAEHVFRVVKENGASRVEAVGR
ncbi:MAG: AAA family ATPase [Thermoplasmatota archaeon]